MLYGLSWLVSLLVGYEFVNGLNPCCKIILVKLIFPEVRTKFSAFYETRLFITIFTTACQLTLPQGRRIHFTPFLPMLLRSIIVVRSLSPHVQLAFQMTPSLHDPPLTLCIHFFSPLLRTAVKTTFQRHLLLFHEPNFVVRLLDALQLKTFATSYGSEPEGLHLLNSNILSLISSQHSCTITILQNAI